MRQRIGSWPLAAYFVVTSVLFALLTWTFDLLTHPGQNLVISAVVHLTEGLFFGAVMTVFLAIIRRRSGGDEGMLALRAAIRSGTLPTDATTESWAPRLRRAARSAGLRVWLGPVEFGLFALMGVLLLVSDGKVYWLIFIVGFAAAGIAISASSQRERGRIATMLAELERRS